MRAGRRTVAVSCERLCDVVEVWATDLELLEPGAREFRAPCASAHAINVDSMRPRHELVSQGASLTRCMAGKAGGQSSAPVTESCHTAGKEVVEQKFCVTAIESSRFSTVCHHPPGT